MDERIIVSVNGTPVSIFRGMKVKHALVAYDQSVFTSCERGELAVEDGNGFRVGLDGALSDGAMIFTKPAGRL